MHQMNTTVKNGNPLLKEPPTALRRDFVWLAWSGFISIANSLLVWVFMARMRDVEEVGRFTIVMGLYALFFSVVSLGLMPYLVNEITRRKLSGNHIDSSVIQFASGASVFLLISGIFCSVLMAASGFLVSGSWQVRVATIVLSLAMIPSGVNAVAEAAAIAYGRTRLVAGVSTLENGLRTLVPLALILAGYDILAICVSFVVVRFIAMAAYALAGRSYIARFAFNGDEIRAIARASPTFASTIFFASLTWQTPLILLGYLGSEAELAEFGAASRFLIPVSILMASYANAVQPAIAKYVQLTPESWGLYLSKIASYPLFAATCAAICSFFLSSQVLTILFGESYERAAPILNILAITTIPFCVIMIVARALVAVKAQRIDLFANILGVAICVCAGAILIPRYGAVGAATAQLLAFVSMALVEVGYLSRKVREFNVWRSASISTAGIFIIYLILWNQ